MRTPANLYIDSPSWPTLLKNVSYWGVTTGAGAAAGTTLVSSNLATEPSYEGQYVKVLSGDAAGQVRRIVTSTTGATGTVTVDRPFSDAAGAAEQITASTLFVITSEYDDSILAYSTSTGAGAADGSTLIDTGLSTTFTVDDQIIGHTVRILVSSTATLQDQEREVHDYDTGTGRIYFATPFTAQVPASVTYVILRNRPSSTGGPQPEPAIEETEWKLGWYDDFSVADATADTERWSSEYISAGAADGSADINTTSAGRLYVNITSAAAAAAEYGVRAHWPNIGNKYLAAVDCSTTVTSPNANFVWGGLSVSRGIAWDSNNYLRIYKRQSNAAEGIAVEYQIAGGGVTTTSILTTTQDDLAFKIERVENVWRAYYSLTQAPRRHWVLAVEVEDATGAMTEQTSFYLSAYNAEDAAGQRIQATFNQFEVYYTLGNFENILIALSKASGALAYLGYCHPGMAASTTVVVCPNLAGFLDDAFNTGYQMIVLRNANSLGNAPEREMRDITDYVSATGTFTTAAFSSNVEANDIVLVIHTSVATRIVANGTFTTSSATVPADTDRTEANDYWNGCYLMPVSGSAAFQTRRIVDFANAGGVFTIDGDHPFTAATGTVDYVVIAAEGGLIPGTDSTNAQTTEQAIGAKADTADYTYNATTSSLMRLVKGILGSRVIAEGTLTTSSATVPADTGRGEANDYWNGCLLMPVAGGIAFEPRRIVDFANAGGVFTLDPNNPFTAVPGLVAYVVIADQSDFVPSADGTNNRNPSDIVGNKTSTAIYVKDAVSDIIRYLKGLMDAGITANGTADAGSGVGAVVDAARTEANDWWNGQTLLMLTGSAAFQKRPITDFDAATDTITIAPNFDAAVGAGDVYVILAHYNMIVPRTADSTANALISDVVGRKDDTVDYTPGATQSSLIRLVKGILGSRVIAEGTFTTSSATVPADTGRTEANDYWNGNYLMTVTGAVAFQPRLIVDFANAGGVFTLDAQYPFTAAPGLVAYVIIAAQSNLVPAADATTNTTTAHVVGNKADAAVWAASTTASVIAYLKGLVGMSIVATGTFTTSSATVPADTGRSEANDYWNGCLIATTTGAVAGQPRLIADFANAGGVFTLDAEHPFTAAPGLVTYVILANQGPLIPAADSANNYTVMDVAGNKTDAIPAMNAAPANSSAIAHLKAILERVGATPADADDSVLTNIGQRDDTATADTLADITTTSVQAKLRRLLLRFSADAFAATIQGASRTDVENMLGSLATYISAAGAAYSSVVDPGGATRTEIETVLEDIAAMIAGAGITTYPAAAEPGNGISIAEGIRWLAEVVRKGAGTQIAAGRSLVDALGTDGTTVADSAVSVLGAIGANNANNAFSSATVIENVDGSILERLEANRPDAAVGAHTILAADGTNEITVATLSPLNSGRISAIFDLNTLVAAAEGGTVMVRLKNMIDGLNLRTIDRTSFLVGTDDVHPTVSGFVQNGTNTVQLTIQVNSAVTAGRNIPYVVIG